MLRAVRPSLPPIPRAPRTPPRRAGIVVGLALVAIAAQPACIFFVGSAGPLETTSCRFSGDTKTACGICIATNCQLEVNTCCTTSSCQGDLSFLDSCAGSGDVDACAVLLQGASYDDSSGDFSDLATCAKQCTSCGGSDGGLSGLLDGSPGGPANGISCTSQGSSGCSCLAEAATSPNTVVCDTSGFTTCCASTSYPSLGGSCSCSDYACVTDGEGDCYCSANPDLLLGDGTPTSSCTTGGGATICCLNNEGLCFCNGTQSSCGSGTMVDACGATMSGVCGTGESSVLSCSTP